MKNPEKLWHIVPKRRFGNSTGSALGRQTEVCGVLNPQYIPEYASDLRSCIHPFAKPMNPHRTFQKASKRAICFALVNVSLCIWTTPSWAITHAVQVKHHSVVRKAPATSAPATQPAAPLPGNKTFRPAEIGRVIFVQNEPSLLEHVLPPMVFHHKTLSEVLSTFSTLTNTNVAAGWAAMAHAGIKFNRRLTLRLPGQGYKLDLVAALKSFAPNVRMVISADQNVIFVNTQAADNQHLIMRTYWIQDLIANIPRYINPQSFGKKRPAEGSHGKRAPQEHAAGGPTKAAKASGNRSAGQSNPPSMERNILQLITDHVEPKIWLNHGGKATISQVGNKVIVIAPASVQALLQGPSHYNPNAAPLFMTVSY